MPTYRKHWFLTQSNLGLSTKLEKIAKDVGLPNFLVLAYLSKSPLLRHSSAQFEAGQEMVKIFIDYFDVDVLASPKNDLASMVQKLNDRTSSLGWRWSVFKQPFGPADALILKVELASGEKIALKVHVAAYEQAYVNYVTEPLRAQINQLANTTTVIAHQTFFEKKANFPFHVLAYPFIDGVPLTSLGMYQAKSAVNTLQQSLDKQGFTLTGAFNISDALLLPGDLPVLTDWNKISPKVVPEYPLANFINPSMHEFFKTFYWGNPKHPNY